MSTQTNSRRVRVQQLVHVGREGEALDVLLEQLGQAGLVDGQLAAAEHVDLLLDDVADHDLVAELGEAGGGHQTDPADSDHADRRFFTVSGHI